VCRVVVDVRDVGGCWECSGWFDVRRDGLAVDALAAAAAFVVEMVELEFAIASDGSSAVS